MSQLERGYMCREKRVERWHNFLNARRRKLSMKPKRVDEEESLDLAFNRDLLPTKTVRRR